MSSRADNTWNFPVDDKSYPSLGPADFSGSLIPSDILYWDRDAAPPKVAAATSFPTTDFSTFNMETPRPTRRDPVASGVPFDLFEPHHFTTSHLKAANKRFDEANDRADLVLAVGYERAEARAKLDPSLAPRSPLPSLHRRVPLTDEVRKSIGKSSAAGKNAAVKTSRRMWKRRMRPFLAPHRGKGAAWRLVVNELKKAKEFRDTTIPPQSVQQKAEALVAFKKNPGQNRKLANIIGKGTAAGITIAALLEQLEEQYDSAKDKSDSAKARIKKKNDEDRVGGEVIREASMKRYRKRTTPLSDGELTDNESVAKPTPASRSTAASSSIEIIDSDDDHASQARKTKRRRRNDRSSDTAELVALMRAENERRAKHDERIQQSFDTSVGNCSKQKDEYISLLRDLIADERKSA
ncbi:hypothetical protein B0H19DRAFT_1079420 [Mycena capillaripes]|nr:hypothetical protein B0H19DRAFT_1079420 [Mycena capillaripes]